MSCAVAGSALLETDRPEWGSDRVERGAMGLVERLGPPMMTGRPLTARLLPSASRLPRRVSPVSPDVPRQGVPVAGLTNRGMAVRVQAEACIRNCLRKTARSWHPFHPEKPSFEQSPPARDQK